MANLHPPKGIYHTLKDWLDANVEPYSQKSIFKEIYPIHHFSRTIPNPPTRYPNYLQGGFVAVIPEGRVWGNNGSIITPDNHLIWELSIEWGEPGFGHSIFKSNYLPPISHHYHTVAPLTHIGSRNYYHWMYEVLPRIDLLQKSGIVVDNYTVGDNPVDVPFQTETLNHLGISIDKLIKTNNQFHVQVENLVITSPPDFATKWGYDFLRDTFLTRDSIKSSGNKRIYISRKGPRRILNESELMDVLTNFGFIEVELESMSVAEQIELFASAEVIIGPHGAGFTNLTFCQPGTKVLEIFPATYITCLYWLISSLGNLKHYYYVGDYGERDTDRLHEHWTGYDNITINIKKLLPVLKKMKL